MEEVCGEGDQVKGDLKFEAVLPVQGGLVAAEQGSGAQPGGQPVEDRVESPPAEVGAVGGMAPSGLGARERLEPVVGFLR